VAKRDKLYTEDMVPQRCSRHGHPTNGEPAIGHDCCTWHWWPSILLADSCQHG